MSSDNKKLSDKEIVETLFDLMYEAEVAAKPDVDARLQEQQLDPDSLAAEGVNFVKNLKRELRFKTAGRKLKGFVDFLSSVTAEATGRARRVLIEKMLRPQDEQLQLVFNRRLTEITDTDLESLDDDALLLELWKDFSSKAEED